MPCIATRGIVDCMNQWIKNEIMETACPQPARARAESRMKTAHVATRIAYTSQTGPTLLLVTLAAICLLTLLAPRAEARQDFSYYKYILDRHPFGKLPPPRDPNAEKKEIVEHVLPPEPPPQWLNTLKLVAIIEPDDEDELLRVGLFDQKEKKSYFINLGETYTYHVFEAYYKEEKALIGKDDRKYWLFMDGRPPYEDGMEPEGDGATVAKPSPGRPSVAASNPRVRRIRRARGRSTPALSKEEYQRIKHTLPPPVSPAKMAARAKGELVISDLDPEDMEAYLREYQMELIRAKGEMGPALPIPLTPEMDAKLVEEGVLPPAE